MSLGDKPNEDHPKQADPPDGRGDRPEDPNEFAKWLLDQTTEQDQRPNDDQPE